MRTTIATIKRRASALENPYLATLADGGMTKDDFVETQIQFMFAVVFFSRPMSALAGRLPRPQMRLALLENIRDEHGDGRLTNCHESTFLEFLARLGVEGPEIDQRALWPEVRAFNTTLAGACSFEDVYTALAALGMIEDLFSGISAAIGKAVVARGFLAANEIVHYATHEELDVTHAEGFYASLYEAYESHPRYRYQIDQGLELGAYIFMRLYEDLYRSRGRRWFREVRGPHSTADGCHIEGR
jgi:pyrroloquinoline quinone (PQQ) biosynthesis protein C